MIEWFLHADNGGIIFYSTLHLWRQNAGGPLQFYLASFLVVLKILSLTFAGNVLKQKLVLFRVRLNRLWLGFTTRFWISMTELFVTMNSFPITEKKRKSMHLSMDLWHSNNMKVILLNFAKDHCFWTLRTLNCWLHSFFLYWLFPNFIHEFPKNIQPPKTEPPTLW